MSDASADRSAAREARATAAQDEAIARQYVTWANRLSRQAEADRGTEMDQAVAYYRAALPLINPRRSPALCAEAHAGLGVALYECAGGNRAQNIDHAIQHQRAVLALRPRRLHPLEWAMAQYNLSNLCAARPSGQRRQNLEQALACSAAALSVFTRNEHAQDWAMAMEARANALMERPAGERAHNRELALRAYDEALTVFTRTDLPDDWARTTQNVATALMRRLEGDPARNIEQAIACFEAALQVRTRETVPFFWAMTQVNLAHALLDRQVGDKAANVARALAHGALAQQVYTRQAYPDQWADAELLRGRSLPHLHERIACLQGLLAIYTRASAPTRWAVVQQLLGEAHGGLGQAAKGGGDPQLPADHHLEALRHFELALEVATPEAHPVEAGTLLRELCKEHALHGEWTAALAAGDRAIALGEDLLARAYTTRGQLDQSRRTAGLYPLTAWCLLQLGQPLDSLRRLDRGRSRLLTIQLGHGELAPGFTRLPTDLQARMLAAQRTLRAVTSDSGIAAGDLPAAAMASQGPQPQPSPGRARPRARRGPEPAPFSLQALSLREARITMAAHGLQIDFSDRLREAHAALRDLEQEAREADVGYGLQDMDFDTLRSLIPPGGALVTFLISMVGQVAWVVPHDASELLACHAVPLADDVAARVNEALAATSGEAGWLAEERDTQDPDALATWQATLDGVTATLWETLMGPVQGRLEALGLGSASPVLLLPHAVFSLLPLHAAWRLVDGARRYFLDDHAVSFAPSLRAVAVARHRLAQPTRQGSRLLAVIDPGHDLPNAVLEGGMVETCFAAGATHDRTDASHTDGGQDDRGQNGHATVLLHHPHATEAAVITAIAGASHLHFACHGRYDWRDANRSALLLSNGGRLTVARLLSPEVDLSHARLVVMSACETGLVDLRHAPDEFLGLPAAFIAGGAPGVVSAQWAVDDLSTALLMRAFYQRLIGGRLPVAVALQQAQCWLRDADMEELRLADFWEGVYRAAGASGTPDAHAFQMMRYCRANPTAVPYAAPRHWAAFTFHGA